MWINNFKNKTKGIKNDKIINRLENHLKHLDDIQSFFYLISLIALLKNNRKHNFNINAENMILLKPDYNNFVFNEDLNADLDLKFLLNVDKHEINLDINNKKINSNILYNNYYDYIVLLKDKSKNDNLIVLIPTKKQIGGNNSVFNLNKQTGVGYDFKIHTSQGFDIGQNKSPVINIDDLPSEYEGHDSTLYPADPFFDHKNLEGLIEKKKNKFKTFEEGFKSGFDNGYNKGYYFGYSSAAAYLYRFYKKYYADYMEKYRKYMTEKERKSLNKKFDEKMKEYSNKIDRTLSRVDNNVNKKSFFGLFGGASFINEDNKIYDFQKLNSGNEYTGLPFHLAPENLFSLEALQPTKKKGLFDFIKKLFSDIPDAEDPSKHCYKPKKEDLDKMLLLLFNPRFRDVVVGRDSNWNEKVFKKSCNRRNLKLMKYCPNENHSGYEFDPKIGAYYKACKLKKDEKDKCVIL